MSDLCLSCQPAQRHGDTTLKALLVQAEISHNRLTWMRRTAKNSEICGEPPGDHNHQDFLKSIAVQMGGVLRYKWEAYCDADGRSTEVFPFNESSVAPNALQYKLEAYCNRNWKCIAILF